MSLQKRKTNNNNNTEKIVHLRDVSANNFVNLSYVRFYFHDKPYHFICGCHNIEKTVIKSTRISSVKKSSHVANYEILVMK